MREEAIEIVDRLFKTAKYLTPLALVFLMSAARCCGNFEGIHNVTFRDSFRFVNCGRRERKASRRFAASDQPAAIRRLDCCTVTVAALVVTTAEVSRTVEKSGDIIFAMRPKHATVIVRKSWVYADILASLLGEKESGVKLVALHVVGYSLADQTLAELNLTVKQIGNASVKVFVPKSEIVTIVETESAEVERAIGFGPQPK